MRRWNCLSIWKPFVSSDRQKEHTKNVEHKEHGVLPTSREFEHQGESMEQIVLACLRLRIVVVAIAAVLVAAGLWQIRQAPLDIVPEFSPETLQVRTEA